MWEAISQVLNGHNGAFILVAVLIVVFVLVYLSRKGGFAIHTHAFSLGGADREREIIRHQIEIAHASSFELPEILGLDFTEYLTKYMIERVYDKVVEWIIFNHISSSPIYIESKTSAVYNLLLSLNTADSIRTPEVKKNVKDWVIHLVDQLVHTRKYYIEYKRSI